MAGVAVAVAFVVFVAAPRLTADRDNTEPAPAGRPSSTLSPSPSSKPLDTSTWTTYTSDQYGFKVGHPPDWTETRATRDWTFSEDAGKPGSPAQDAFMSPDGEVLVSVWNAPLDIPGTSKDSTTDLKVWVEAYCRASDSEPCSQDPDRTVELCLEKWDCHPGVLVRFDFDVQAFFSGGIYDADAMTIVSVWRGPSDPAVAPYRGSQRLLEAFLSTMQVWPASTPREERECYGKPPSGLDCGEHG
jgi:hypothetical protein